MTTLNTTFSAEKSERFPVYCQYGGQSSAQHAYISLDLRSGECAADYNPETGCMPISHWHNLVLTFSLNPQAFAKDIAKIIEENAVKFQAILDGSSIVWNGSNNVGVLNEDAQGIFDNLDRGGEGFTCEQTATRIGSSDLYEWLGEDGIFPSGGQTPEEFAISILESDGEGSCYFSDGLHGNPGAVVEALTEMWSEILYADTSLPKDVAQFLLDTGCCDDSAWLEELTGFAKA